MKIWCNETLAKNQAKKNRLPMSNFVNYTPKDSISHSYLPGQFEEIPLRITLVLPLTDDHMSELPTYVGLPHQTSQEMHTT